MPPANMINVTISGAVQSPGPQSLRTPATVRKGPDAAGGFAAAMLQMKPAEVITVRRPSGTSAVDTFRFFTSDVPPTREEFELQDGDLVVVQWQIEAEKN